MRCLAWSISYLFRDPFGISTMTRKCMRSPLTTLTFLHPSFTRPSRLRLDQQRAHGEANLAINPWGRVGEAEGAAEFAPARRISTVCGVGYDDVGHPAEVADAGNAHHGADATRCRHGSVGLDTAQAQPGMLVLPAPAGRAASGRAAAARRSPRSPSGCRRRPVGSTT